MIEPTERLLKFCAPSLERFSLWFLRNRFNRPFDDPHKMICGKLDDESVQKIAIAAPRGSGKSSLFSFAKVLHYILYRRKHFISLISASERMAKKISDNVRHELMVNDEISKHFQPIDRGEDFSKEQWVAYDTFILPRGAGQQIRGWNYKGHRPDLFVLDDVEDPEHIRSEDYRSNLREWFFGSVVNSVDRGSRNWRILFVCTIMHSDCLFFHLEEDPGWETIRLPLVGEDGESLWPNYIPTKEAKELEAEYRRMGQLDTFYREYMNMPSCYEEYGFNASWFKYYDLSEDQLNADPDNVSVVMLDPARSLKEGSAHTAIVGVTVNTVSQKIYVRDVIDAQLNPSDIIDETFRMAKAINARLIAPEVTGLESWITWPMENEMLRTGKWHWEILPIRPRRQKGERAGVLIPLYRRGLVYHNRDNAQKLEQQILSFPRPKRWDMLDALSQIVVVMDECSQYFVSDFDDDPVEVEREYAGISYEPALEGWRIL